MLVFLYLQGIVFWALILIIDSSILQSIFYKLRHQPLTHETEGQTVSEDSDVAAEHQRIMESPPSTMNDSLILKELTKDYGSLRAVDGITLGVKPGECFGLLGINGAGKTSTFKMLTGDESVTGGNAWLDGFDIKRNIRMVRDTPFLHSCNLWYF